MLSWVNVRFNRIIIWSVAIVFGSLISVCADFALSYFAPVTCSFYLLRFIAIALGSSVSGILARNNGEVIGAVVSFIYIIYIAQLLFYPRPYLTNETIFVNWFILIPIGILLITTGIIGGFFGGKLRQKIANILGKK